MTIQTQGTSADRTRKNPCPHCKKMFFGANLLRHVKPCQLYFKYILVVSNAYQCAICLKLRKKNIRDLYQHIKNCRGLDESEKGKEQHVLMENTMIPGSELHDKIKTTRVDLKHQVKCKFCNLVSLPHNMKSRMRVCKKYVKFFEKTCNGFKCSFCSHEVIKRKNIYEHIREKHSQEKEFKKNKERIGTIEDKKDVSEGYVKIEACSNDPLYEAQTKNRVVQRTTSC